VTDRLREIKARRAAIVGTNWQWDSYSRIDAAVPYGSPWDRCEPDDEGPVRTEGGGVAFIAWMCQRPDHEGHGDYLHSAEAAANAQFIEQAPKDIDWLVAELERQERRAHGGQ
jgi:hypothetical protein